MTDSCPVCGGDRSRPVTDGAPFRRCRACGAVFNTAHTPLSYSDSYFTTDYKAQYGKTYEEDFDVIYRASLSRLEKISALRLRHNCGKPESVFDIGCALGFFLKAAEDSGYTRLSGLEISPFAAGYAKKRFGYDIRQEPFDPRSLSGGYDAITAWYFLEHLPDTGQAIGAIYGALRPGGVAAFSVPSFFGPLYLFHRREWERTHPVDHRVDFSPASVRAAMKKAGFRFVEVHASGIHPERVVPRTSFLHRPFAVLYRLFARRTAFSDTIEVYAVK